MNPQRAAGAAAIDPINKDEQRTLLVRFGKLETNVCSGADSQ